MVTRLPIDNLIDLSEWKFLLARKIFFPGCRLDLDTITQRALALDVRVAEVASATGRASRLAAARLVRNRSDPYLVSADVARLREVLRHWSDDVVEPPLVPRAMGRELYLHSVFPERRKLFGFEQRTTQPAGTLRDGSTLWFY